MSRESIDRDQPVATAICSRISVRGSMFSTELGSNLTRFHQAEETEMKDAKTYREYAADCRRMAKLMSSKDKDVLMKMAEAWDERAREADARREGKDDKAAE